MTTPGRKRLGPSRCVKQTRRSKGEMGRCAWTGRNHHCFRHAKHTFTMPPDEDTLGRAPPKILNQRVLPAAVNVIVGTRLTRWQNEFRRFGQMKLRFRIEVQPEFRMYFCFGLHQRSQFPENCSKSCSDILGSAMLFLQVIAFWLFLVQGIVYARTRAHNCTQFASSFYHFRDRHVRILGHFGENQREPARANASHEY
jgi:hypothetical protein